MDVKSIVTAFDLSTTGQAMTSRVDSPCQLPGPGHIPLQFLNNSANGGDWFLIDVFGHADQVRCSDPEAPEVLCATNVGFQCAAADAILDRQGPRIELGQCLLTCVAPSDPGWRAIYRMPTPEETIRKERNSRND